MQLLGALTADLAEIHAIELCLGFLKLELVHPLLRLRKIKRSGLKHTAALARFFLKAVVEVHGVMLKTADVGAIVQAMNARRRMPRAARG